MTMAGKYTDIKENILRRAREKGPLGLTGQEIQDTMGISLVSACDACQHLEAEGRLRILVYSPLVVMDKKALEEIEDSLFSFIKNAQGGDFGTGGIRKEQVFRDFSLPHRLIELVLRRMIRSGRIRSDKSLLTAVRVEPELSQREKNLLSELETMCAEGEFRRKSITELQQHLKVPAETFNRFLEMLLEKKKVIDGKEGILFHSRWLEDIITSLKIPGKKTLTVAEFKKLTGLSRKFVIPLLELLDQMGVTRKEGSTRIIL